MDFVPSNKKSKCLSLSLSLALWHTHTHACKNLASEVQLYKRLEQCYWLNKWDLWRDLETDVRRRMMMWVSLFHQQRPWKRKRFAHFVWLWILSVFLFAGFADVMCENLYGTEIPFCFMLQFFRLVPFAKAKRKKFTHFVWLWKLAVFWVFNCRLCMAVQNCFMGQRYFFCFTLEFFRLVPSAKALKTEKEIYLFCLIVKIGSFLFASFAWWIWTFLWNRGTFLLHAWILQIGSLFTIENDNNNGHFCGTWSLAKSKASVPYKKMQKSVWMHTVDKVKRFPAIKPLKHAIIYTQPFL